MYIKIILITSLLIIFYSDTVQPDLFCLLPQLKVLSTAQVKDTNVTLTAFYTIYTLPVFNTFIATPDFFWIENGELNQILIYSPGSGSGAINKTCDWLGNCNLQQQSPNSLIYILFDITYGNNYSIRAPVIAIQMRGFHPDIQLLNTTCYSNTTLRHADAKNFHQVHTEINVTQCYCCPISVLWESCPNSGAIPSTYTMEPVYTTSALGHVTTKETKKSTIQSTAHPTTSIPTTRPTTAPSRTCIYGIDSCTILKARGQNDIMIAIQTVARATAQQASFEVYNMDITGGYPTGMYLTLNDTLDYPVECMISLGECFIPIGANSNVSLIIEVHEDPQISENTKFNITVLTIAYENYIPAIPNTFVWNYGECYNGTYTEVVTTDHRTTFDVFSSSCCQPWGPICAWLDSTTMQTSTLSTTTIKKSHVPTTTHLPTTQKTTSKSSNHTSTSKLTTEPPKTCKSGIKVCSTLQASHEDVLIIAQISAPYTTSNNSATIDINDLYISGGINKSILLNFNDSLQHYVDCSKGSCSIPISESALVILQVEVEQNNGEKFNVTILKLSYEHYVPSVTESLVDANKCYNNTTTEDVYTSHRIIFNVNNCFCCMHSSQECKIPDEHTTKMTTMHTTKAHEHFTIQKTEASTKSSPKKTSEHAPGHTTTPMTTVLTSTPTSLQPDCTNPTDPIVQIYCSLNNTAQTPSQIAANLTNHLNPDNLTGYDLFLLSQIMHILTKERGKLNETDFQDIAKLADKLLFAPRDTFVHGNNNMMGTTIRILTSIHYLIANAPANISFLDGNHYGVASFDINCTNSGGDTQLGDTGSMFQTFGTDDNTESIISIPTNAICHGQEWYAHPPHGSDPKQYDPPPTKGPSLFEWKYWSNLWHERLNSSPYYQSGIPLQGRYDRPHRRIRRDHHGKPLFNEEGDDSGSTVTQDTSTSDACASGFWYGDNRVMTGTLLDENNTDPNTFQFVEINGVRQNIVKVKYSKKKIARPLHGTLKLSWFNRLQLLWSHDTCSFSEEGDFWVSECNHLTDFTLIVDGRTKDPTLCNNAINVISYVINIASIVSLIILNLIFILHRVSFLKGTAIHRFLYARTTVDIFTILYNTILLAFYVFFGIFSDEGHTSGTTACMVIAGIEYWLLLCCVCMSVFQAWRILKVFAWTTAGENIMGKLTHNVVILIVTLGFPSGMALILGLAFKDFYNRDDEFCWIRPDYIVPGVVIPLSLLVFNGLFCLVIISFRLFPKLCGVRLIRTNSNSIGKRRASKDKLLALFFMQITLGIPWILQYLTLFTPSVTAWHYLFTVINGSQGTILLIIYFYKRYKQYQLTRRDSSSEGSEDPKLKYKRSSTKETYISNGVHKKLSNRISNKIFGYANRGNRSGLVNALNGVPQNGVAQKGASNGVQRRNGVKIIPRAQAYENM